MKKLKKSAAFFMAALFAVLMILPGTPSVKTEAASFSDGDTFEYGYYPQSLVEDESLVSALDSLVTDSESFGFFSGTGSRYDGNMSAGDFMTYSDVVYEGAEYRRVDISSYRPYLTGLAADDTGDNSYQDDNGYYVSAHYWFKFEPIIWKVVDASSGLVLSESVIDSQPFRSFVYRSPSVSDPKFSYLAAKGGSVLCANYVSSNLRLFLNGDFSSLAFNDSESVNTVTSVNDNTGFYSLSGVSGYEKLDFADTEDSVFLLSYDEAQSLGDNEDRLAYPTDYAKCMGVYTYKYTGSSTETSTYDAYDGVAAWWLRTAGSSSNFVCCVTNGGAVKEEFYPASTTSCGVRPAMKLENLETYEISFDVSPASGAPQKLIKAKNQPLTLPTSEAKLGPLSVIGWSEQSGAEEPDYLTGDEFVKDENTILYAVFGDADAPEISVSGVTENLSGSQTITFTVSDNIGSAGYYFGSSPEFDESDITPFSDTEVSIEINQSGTYYFTAFDSAGNYSEPISVTFYLISFDADDGEVSPAEVLAKEGVSFVLPSASKSDYTFKGWSYNRGASSADFAAGESFTATEDTSLYAVWQTVSYNPTAGAALKVKSGEVDYRSTVTLIANALGVPDDYILVLYENGEEVARGDNKSVSIVMNEMKSGRSFTVKVEDSLGNVAYDSSGNALQKDIEVKVNTCFFAKIISFFRCIFHRLPVVTLEEK